MLPVWNSISAHYNALAVTEIAAIVIGQQYSRQDFTIDHRYTSLKNIADINKSDDALQ